MNQMKVNVHARMLSVFSVITLIVLFSLTLMGCPPDGKNELLDITIFHTNDLHSHFRADPANSEKNPFNLGGMARLKTLITRLRAEKTNSFFVDAGDWSEGNSHFFSDAGTNILKMMNVLGYDASVVGNHDFLNGPIELANTLERANLTFPMLGANKDLGDSALQADRSRIEKLMKDYVILTTNNGIRVAFIGLLCVDFTFYQYFLPGVITNAKDKASQLSQYIHNNNLADVIVLLSHNTFDTNLVWAKQIPWINVIISGHAHVKTAQPEVVTNAGDPVYVVEAKQWGQFLGEMNLTVDRNNRRVYLKKYVLHPVSPDIPEDPAVASMVDAAEHTLSQKFGKDIIHDHVGDCPDEYPQDEKRETILGNLAADAYRTTLRTDLAMESGSLIGIGLSEGPLNSLQSIDIAPHIYQPYKRPDGSYEKPFPEFGHSWTLHQLTMKGSDLLLLLNLPLRLESIMPTGFISTSGAQIIYSQNWNAILPIRSVQILNKQTEAYEPLNGQKVYTIAVHDGLLSAVHILKDSLHLPINIISEQNTGIQTWEATLGYITQNPQLKTEDYEQGFRFLTEEADLSVYEHQLKIENNILKIEIQNQGMQASPTGVQVQVTRGKVNDAVNDFTTGNESIPVGPVKLLSSIPAKGRTLLQIPLTNLLQGTGVYAFRVELKKPAGFKELSNGSFDGSLANNTVVRHLRVE